MACGSKCVGLQENDMRCSGLLKRCLKVVINQDRVPSIAVKRPNLCATGLSAVSIYSPHRKIANAAFRLLSELRGKQHSYPSRCAWALSYREAHDPLYRSLVLWLRIRLQSYEVVCLWALEEDARFGSHQWLLAVDPIADASAILCCCSW